MEQYYYSPATGQTYSAYQAQALFGVNVVTADISVLNQRGLYPVLTTYPTFDTSLYDATHTWSIVPVSGGEAAERTWVGVPKSLTDAKGNGTVKVKLHADETIFRWSTTSGYTTGMLTAVAAQPEISRAPRYSTELSTLLTYTNVLNGQLDYIDAATTVDEINAVVNPPDITGSVTINATGNDLDESFVTAITGVPADDLSLYFPSTDTTVAYNSGTSSFPATPGVFSGDFLGKVMYLGIFNLAEFDASAPPVTVPIDWKYYD